MQKFLLVVGILLLINVTFLALTSNPHFGHMIQFATSIVIILYARFYKKISKRVHLWIRIFCVIPIGSIIFLASYGNYKNVDYQEEVLIVLGAGLHGEEVTPHLASRLDMAVEYFNKNPQVMIIVCGGLGERQLITEAKAMEHYLIARGVPRESIIKEEKSTSTYENLVFAKEIISEHFPEEVRVALITSDFHIYRSVRLAESLGLSVNRIGAPTPWILWPLNYLRETLAVIRLWLF